MSVKNRKFPRLYNLLKKSGHSPIQAAQIVLDAKRGVPHARRWIGTHYMARQSLLSS